MSSVEHIRLRASFECSCKLRLRLKPNSYRLGEEEDEDDDDDDDDEDTAAAEEDDDGDEDVPFICCAAVAAAFNFFSSLFLSASICFFKNSSCPSNGSTAGMSGVCVTAWIAVGESA